MRQLTGCHLGRAHLPVVTLNGGQGGALGAGARAIKRRMTDRPNSAKYNGDNEEKAEWQDLCVRRQGVRVLFDSSIALSVDFYSIAPGLQAQPRLRWQ